MNIYCSPHFTSHFRLSWNYHYYLLSAIFFYMGDTIQFIEDDHPTTARKKFGKSKPSIFTAPLPCRKHIFCNFMGLEMVTSISDNLNDLKTWNICMYDRLWCRVYFLHHGGGLSVPKYIMWKLKHQRSVNHYLIINKARVLNRFVNQCIAIVNFQTTHWRPWYNFMHLFISKNLENIWYIHQVSFAWKTRR